MKLTNKLIIALMTFFALGACESYIGGAINQDPNNPVEVPISAMLPAIQINLADVYGGEFSRFNCILTQQVEGVLRFNHFHYSGLTPNRFNTVWQNIYEKILNELQIVKRIASEKGYNHYQGVANVLEAYTLMIATDVWDDMPYSEAFQGVEKMNPAFDKQSSIYETVFKRLDEAINLFDGPSGPFVPQNEDVFFGGNIGQWKKAAHATKARGYLHLKDYAKAWVEARNSFESEMDNVGFQYPDAKAAGPWYRFNDNRTGDIEFHPQMRGLMKELNDTNRLALVDRVFYTDHPYLVADFFQEILTYREMQFIIAESDVRLNPGGTSAAHTAYLNGIKASFDRFGLSEDEYNDYIRQPMIDPGAGNLSLEMVMTQKYIALFLDPESYSDWRRTEIPKLTPLSGLHVPVRWQYPATEYDFNSNAPDLGSIDIFMDRVWWNR